jgi:hypothetical protein
MILQICVYSSRLLFITAPWHSNRRVMLLSKRIRLQRQSKKRQNLRCLHLLVPYCRPSPLSPLDCKFLRHHLPLRQASKQKRQWRPQKTKKSLQRRYWATIDPVNLVLLFFYFNTFIDLLQRFEYPDRVLVDRDILEHNISKTCKCGHIQTYSSWEMKGKSPSPTMVLKCNACRRCVCFHLII